MCGIAGIIAKNEKAFDGFDRFISSSNLMAHRGPDFNNIFRFENTLLIHYRLSIIDLDSRSNQPFISKSGNSICTYNGEIYNFRELSSKYNLDLRTTSDTEVMLESYEYYGNSVVPQWNGIFSICILNRNKRKISLIRDRFGVKPLYYYEDSDVFIFASEAKVIFNWLSILPISHQGLAEYLWFGNTIGNQTLIKDVKKFPPANILEINLVDFTTNNTVYWSIPRTDVVNKSENEIIFDIRELLGKAVNKQLISDVPVGVLLSGGIDSSALVAFASQKGDRKIETYSVEYDYNIGGKSELDRARLIAKKYNTVHNELRVTSKNIPETFNELVFQYDEPFADTASIPLYQLSKLCSKDKKVILQGDGGDELFAGYRRYNIMDWVYFWRYASTFSYRFIKNPRLKERMKRMSFILNQKDNGMRMAYLLTQDVPYKNPYGVFNEAMRNRLMSYNPFKAYLEVDFKYKNEDLVQRLLYADVKILLPNTYLEKVDKATMLTSVESRVPFLDHDLSDYVLALPSNMKVRMGRKKHLLRKALIDLVPDEILNGKKRGFEVPYKTWLKNDLFDFAQAKFQESKMSFIDTKTLTKLLETHKKGQADYGPLLWKMLVLTSWFDFYKNKIEF